MDFGTGDEDISTWNASEIFQRFIHDVDFTSYICTPGFSQLYPTIDQ